MGEASIGNRIGGNGRRHGKKWVGKDAAEFMVTTKCVRQAMARRADVEKRGNQTNFGQDGGRSANKL